MILNNIRIKLASLHSSKIRIRSEESRAHPADSLKACSKPRAFKYLCHDQADRKKTPLTLLHICNETLSKSEWDVVTHIQGWKKQDFTSDLKMVTWIMELNRCKQVSIYLYNYDHQAQSKHLTRVTFRKTYHKPFSSNFEGTVFPLNRLSKSSFCPCRQLSQSHPYTVLQWCRNDTEQISGSFLPTRTRSDFNF